MPNIQVTHETNVNNAHSESSVVVNPRDPSQMVAASKRFNNLATYDFTLATAFSADGGRSWQNSAALAMPGFTLLTDPTMAWDDAGNVFLVGLNGINPPIFDTIGIVIYKSTDGGRTWSDPNLVHTSTGDDKQWAAGDGNPASPHHGNVYTAWDDVRAGGGLAFARTRDHGTTWTGVGGTSAGSIIATGSIYPEVNVSADGAIYIVTIAGSELRLLVSKDGGDSFRSMAPPALGITTLEASLPSVHGFPVLPGGTFRVISDPTACAVGAMVHVAWADHREGVSRIYHARSLDGGSTWTTGPSGQPLLTGPLPADLQHFHPQIVAGPNGVIGCVFYEFGPKPRTPLIDVLIAFSADAGASFKHFRITDQAWNPAVGAPLAHGQADQTFIGDYMGLDSSPLGFHPVWTDTRTGIQELWTATVPVGVRIGGLSNVVLGESSDAGPAVASYNGRLFLAWRGSGNPQLNMSVSNDGGASFGGKRVFGDTSPFAPALVSHNGGLFLAWTGEGDGQLNVARVALEIVATSTISSPLTVDSSEFVHWVAADPNGATGRLHQSDVGLVGPMGTVFVFNDAYPGYGSESFSPRLHSTGMVEIVGGDDHSFRLTFGSPVQDPVFFLGSLASIMTFAPDTVVTRISGDANFRVSGNTVTGELMNATVGPDRTLGPTDSNGTVQLTGVFASLTFSLTPNYPDHSIPDGVFLQIGAAAAS
ncbi:MAG: sialidase family protein [Jatrophihabitantaceae bacterium]